MATQPSTPLFFKVSAESSPMCATTRSLGCDTDVARLGLTAGPSTPAVSRAGLPWDPLSVDREGRPRQAALRKERPQLRGEGEIAQAMARMTLSTTPV